MEKGTILSFLRNCAGSVLPLTAMMLPLVIGSAGFGVDAGMWVMNGRNLQTAADAASIAAAWEVAYDNDDNADDAALKEAINNGYKDTSENSLEIEISVNDDGNTVVTATISQKDQTYFSNVLFQKDIFASVAAASAVIVPSGDYCLLSLSDDADGAVTAVGAVDIDSAGCGIAVNSDSDSAIDLNGNVDINVGDVSIAGDYQVVGNADFNATSINTNAGKTQDPYEDLELPDTADDSCSFNNRNVNGNATLNPGVYCGGLTIRGNGAVTMNPGVYIIRNGDFTVTGNGSLTALNVSIVLTSDNGNYGDLEVSGGKTMRFTAPEEGDDMEGIAFYQDRDAPAQAQCNSLVGNASVDFWGAAYFPSRCLNIGGNSASSAFQGETCTRIIADTVKFHGTPNFGNDCEGIAVEDIGQMNVRLIM